MTERLFIQHNSEVLLALYLFECRLLGTSILHTSRMHASPLQSGSIGDTYECSALVGVLNELAHGERLS
jgi:hypothetical protein